MGCGCGKKAGAAGVVAASRSAVYQAMNPDGSVLSEHDSPVLARNAALAVGGRVRVTSRATTPATTP